MQLFARFGSRSSFSAHKTTNYRDSQEASRLTSEKTRLFGDLMAKEDKRDISQKLTSPTDNAIIIKSCLKKKINSCHNILQLDECQQSPSKHFSESECSTSNFSSQGQCNKFDQTPLSMSCSTMASTSAEKLGAHQGQFAQVTFKWTYSAGACPRLVVLHEGKVVHCAQMEERKSSAQTTISSGSTTPSTCIQGDFCGQDKQNSWYEISLFMRAGQDFDFFFEVDGQIRYDFECEFGDVEVAESHLSTDLSAGQMIIANQIQIIWDGDDSAENSPTMASSASSSYSSGSSFNNFANGDEANPQVSWPSSSPGCPQLKQLMTETTTMVMPVTMPAGGVCCAYLGTDESCDVAICASPLTLSASSDSYQAYYQGSQYQNRLPQPQPQPHHVHHQRHQHQEMKPIVTKRVHFWDMQTKVAVAVTAADF